MSKKHWVGIKSGIIMYLAITKIMYWMNKIAELSQNNFEGAWPYILERILGQDLPVILVVTCMVIIDMNKGNFYTRIAIGYGAYMAIVLAYSTTLQLILNRGIENGLAFYREAVIFFTLQYAVVVIILSFKERFTEKLEETPEE